MLRQSPSVFTVILGARPEAVIWQAAENVQHRLRPCLNPVPAMFSAVLANVFGQPSLVRYFAQSVCVGSVLHSLLFIHLRILYLINQPPNTSLNTDAGDKVACAG